MKQNLNFTCLNVNLPFFKFSSSFFIFKIIKAKPKYVDFWFDKYYLTLTVPVWFWAFNLRFFPLKSCSIFLFVSLLPELTRPAVLFSSQAWSCWPSACGGRWVWRPTSLWPLRRAPMHHMSSSGPEPSSLFSGCSVASLHAAAAHGCSNWSVIFH